mmetsp:Transcript_22329/g.67122  ORF Transcript_22329/g.67122 Transcript_22329/m.67122 type:complete len:147 (+) Transcript_22329:782-1222(+)
MGSSIEPADEFPSSLWYPNAPADVRDDELDFDLDPFGGSPDRGHNSDADDGQVRGFRALDTVGLCRGIRPATDRFPEPATELQFAADPDLLLADLVTLNGGQLFTASESRELTPLMPLTVADFGSYADCVDEAFIAEILGPDEATF